MYYYQFFRNGKCKYFIYSHPLSSLHLISAQASHQNLRSILVIAQLHCVLCCFLIIIESLTQIRGKAGNQPFAMNNSCKLDARLHFINADQVIVQILAENPTGRCSTRRHVVAPPLHAFKIALVPVYPAQFCFASVVLANICFRQNHLGQEDKQYGLLKKRTQHTQLFRNHSNFQVKQSYPESQLCYPAIKQSH